jgi:hypothetical protein
MTSARENNVKHILTIFSNLIIRFYNAFGVDPELFCQASLDVLTKSQMIIFDSDTEHFQKVSFKVTDTDGKRSNQISYSFYDMTPSEEYVYIEELMFILNNSMYINGNRVNENIPMPMVGGIGTALDYLGLVWSIYMRYCIYSQTLVNHDGRYVVSDNETDTEFKFRASLFVNTAMSEYTKGLRFKLVNIDYTQKAMGCVVKSFIADSFANFDDVYTFNMEPTMVGSIVPLPTVWRIELYEI